MVNKKMGFTLIELLIVVAIIAILAAIAIPNFLEAQVRSKVSRAKADIRTIVTALEAYCVDSNRYPMELTVALNGAGSGWFRFPHRLTTPQAYMTQGLVDPFRISPDPRDAYTPPNLPMKDRTFMYIRIMSVPTSQLDSRFVSSGGGSDEGNDPPGSPRLDWFGTWALSSFGPDKVAGSQPPTYNWAFAGIIYDPTNGTISGGDIMKRQKTYTKDNF